MTVHMQVCSGAHMQWYCMYVRECVCVRKRWSMYMRVCVRKEV